MSLVMLSVKAEVGHNLEVRLKLPQGRHGVFHKPFDTVALR